MFLHKSIKHKKRNSHYPPVIAKKNAVTLRIEYYSNRNDVKFKSVSVCGLIYVLLHPLKFTAAALRLNDERTLLHLIDN